MMPFRLPLQKSNTSAYRAGPAGRRPPRAQRPGAGRWRVGREAAARRHQHAHCRRGGPQHRRMLLDVMPPQMCSWRGGFVSKGRSATAHSQPPTAWPANCHIMVTAEPYRSVGSNRDVELIHQRIMNRRVWAISRPVIRGRTLASTCPVRPVRCCLQHQFRTVSIIRLWHASTDRRQKDGIQVDAD